MSALPLIIKGSLPGAVGPGSTFTRFILPLAYRRQPYSGPATAVAYRVAPPDHEDERRDYLTPETADTLFERACWFELDAPAEMHEHAFAVPGGPQNEIDACRGRGDTPVLVELEDDLGLDALVVVDHHGQRAGEDQRTALEQVFALLALPRERWTRWHSLVAANDRAYIPGLLAAGATAQEVARVRAADRAAQGITRDEEDDAERALERAERLCSGRLTVVNARHARLATVEDRLHAALGGPGFENLLLIAPAEVNFSGDGRVALALDRRFPGGWYGGALPAQGFWGHAGRPEGLVEAVVAEVGTAGQAARVGQCAE